MSATEDRIEALPDVYDVAAGLGRLIDRWMDEYLASIERRAPDLAVRELARPTTARVRHAGIWRRGDPAPAVVVWPESTTEETEDPDGSLVGDVPLGLLLIAAANDEDATTRLAQRYATAARGIVLHHAIEIVAADGRSTRKRLRSTGGNFLAIDAEERGRIRAGITLTYVARGIYLGNRSGGPPPGSEPRDDPSEPWPPAGTFQTADVQITPTRDPLP